MKLWLDDLRPAPKGWLWVKDVGRAMQVILAFEAVNQEWEDASFDNDLGQHPAGDGYKLLDWMEEHDHWPTNRPTCHSGNPVRRKYIEDTINRHYDQGDG